ncbi:uncharacterized protein LOC107467749 [Arachis duranensis]|uniref:Uncharacterized protein LOC107467749 n=1 Tax=Arachis duranensis TaxID=130453 RepID=A0A6P4C7Q8_ARADU|nr:uncharacterized protein LOC107467749 [Arachis duranensis]
MSILQKAELCGGQVGEEGLDEDMQVLFHCRRSFPKVRIHKLYAKLEDGVDNFGASVSNPQSTTVGGLAQSPGLILGPSGDGEPDHVENAMREDDSDDESDHILGNNEEGTPRNLAARQGSSSSRVQYWVMESDHLKYHGRCKEFGNGCTWIICITLQQRKGNWEVRRYNGTHTCLATSILSDHRQLDHHVICARIFSLVRADAAVRIKVLQEVTEAPYGFRPSYRKVWMAKQKAVAQIYGDWEKSYAELPR